MGKRPYNDSFIHPRRSWSTLESTEMLFLRSKGHTLREIASMMGRSYSSVCGQMDRLRLYGLGEHKPRRERVNAARTHRQSLERFAYDLQEEKDNEARRIKALTLTDFLGQ